MARGDAAHHRASYRLPDFGCYISEITISLAMPGGRAHVRIARRATVAAWPHTTTGDDASMYDFAVPNAKPGQCAKCRGTGRYRWGAIVNGKATKEGECYSCRGTGRQTRRDIRRNVTYNRHKAARVLASM